MAADGTQKLTSSQSQPCGSPERSPLLDSRDYSDARCMGYDGERDPREDGEGLIVRDTSVALGPKQTFHEITLLGPEGEVSLSGIAEIEQVAKALNGFLAGLKREAA